MGVNGKHDYCTNKQSSKHKGESRNAYPTTLAASVSRLLPSFESGARFGSGSRPRDARAEARARAASRLRLGSRVWLTLTHSSPRSRLSTPRCRALAAAAPLPPRLIGGAGPPRGGGSVASWDVSPAPLPSRARSSRPRPQSCVPTKPTITSCSRVSAPARWPCPSAPSLPPRSVDGDSRLPPRLNERPPAADSAAAPLLTSSGRPRSVRSCVRPASASASLPAAPASPPGRPAPRRCPVPGSSRPLLDSNLPPRCFLRLPSRSCQLLQYLPRTANLPLEYF